MQTFLIDRLICEKRKVRWRENVEPCRNESRKQRKRHKAMTENVIWSLVMKSWKNLAT